MGPPYGMLPKNRRAAGEETGAFIAKNRNFGGGRRGAPSGPTPQEQTRRGARWARRQPEGALYELTPKERVRRWWKSD